MWRSFHPSIQDVLYPNKLARNIVLTGETWYAVSQYKTNSGSQQQIHQRVGDIEQAIMLPAGTTRTPSTCSYMYIREPSLVTGSDRYTTDPKGLYFSHLDRIRGLAINHLSVAAPGTLATGATITADFPTDFTKGLIVGVSVYDISWGGLQYIENGSATGAVNLMNEINNFHSVRFAERVKYPFDRTVMPGVMAAAGNSAGTAAATSVGEGFTLEYVKLPSDW